MAAGGGCAPALRPSADGCSTTTRAAARGVGARCRHAATASRRPDTALAGQRRPRIADAAARAPAAAPGRHTRTRLPSSVWYFGGELGKYLPGAIWPVAGRGELAARGGVGRATGYATTLIAYGCMCAAAALVCGVLAPTAATWGWALITLVPVAVVAVHPALLRRVLGLGSRLSRGRLGIRPLPWPGMLRLVACSVPTWLLLGASSVAIARALGDEQDVASCSPPSPHGSSGFWPRRFRPASGCARSCSLR
jgi:hypothetical protein